MELCLDRSLGKRPKIELMPLRASRALLRCFFDSATPRERDTRGAGESRKRPRSVQPLSPQGNQVEQAWPTVQASSQEITYQQVKRQRLEFSQPNTPLPHLSLSTPPPLGPTMTRPHSLPPLGTILQNQFSTPSIGQTVVAGRLKFFAHNWSKISESIWIQKTVTGYEIQLMSQPPVSLRPPKNWSSILTQPANEELTKLLNKGVIVPADPCTPGFYSHIFTIPKKSGEQRLIIGMYHTYTSRWRDSFSYRICSFLAIG